MQAYGENGTQGELDYNTYKFTKEALDIIGAHDPLLAPLFMYLCYQNVHGPTQVTYPTHTQPTTTSPDNRPFGQNPG